MAELQTKICRKCGAEKSTLDFYRDKSKPDGFSSYCKSCSKIIADEWRLKNKDKFDEQNRNRSLRCRAKKIAENPDAVKAYGKEQYKKHRETILLAAKTWRKENPEKATAKSRKNYLANADHIKEKSREWKRLNADRHLASVKKWQQDNKDKVNAYNKASDARNPERILRKRRHHTDTLTDSYVSGAVGIKVKDCPPELIELKREQLTIKRLSRQIKQTTKAHNETSTNIS